ncbi:hypothetical protein [Geodermatophilus maliterrae]|uniref:Uncharacterized protein n=1 Tax=Geodermatophilus maliterrae TaxID=3162531 RepID=A0ABV3XPD9_9ACTN
MRVLTLPAREPTSYGSTGASPVRAALVEQPQDGVAVDVVRLAHAPGTDDGLLAVAVQCRAPLTAAEEAP